MENWFWSGLDILFSLFHGLLLEWALFAMSWRSKSRKYDFFFFVYFFELV